MDVRLASAVAVNLERMDVSTLALASANRYQFWVSFIQTIGAERLAEIGVYRGEFAHQVLSSCPSVRRYYMIDPWRHLDEWNKPANRSSARFEAFYREVLDRTADYADQRRVLRGRTSEVIDQIPDGDLDLAYVDGDHTLRGISIDLITVYPKVRQGGWIAGDDFCRSIFQHAETFEPTFVFPFAVYFAEAVGARVYALPHRQFLIEKAASGFSFIDVTGSYTDLSVRGQLEHRPGRTNRQESAAPATGPAEAARLLGSSVFRHVRQRMASVRAHGGAKR